MTVTQKCRFSFSILLNIFLSLLCFSIKWDTLLQTKLLVKRESKFGKHMKKLWNKFSFTNLFLHNHTHSWVCPSESGMALKVSFYCLHTHFHGNSHSLQSPSPWCETHNVSSCMHHNNSYTSFPRGIKL